MKFARTGLGRPISAAASWMSLLESQAPPAGVSVSTGPARSDHDYQADHHRGHRPLRLDRLSPAAGQTPRGHVALGLLRPLPDAAGMEPSRCYRDGQSSASPAARRKDPTG